MTDKDKQLVKKFLTWIGGIILFLLILDKIMPNPTAQEYIDNITIEEWDKAIQDAKLHSSDGQVEIHIQDNVWVHYIPE